MMTKKLLALAALVALVARPAAAGWQPDKPATSETPANSGNIRNNWTAIAQSVGTANLLADRTFLIWAAGDALAPSYYSVSAPAGSAIARSGTGLGDTTRKVGRFAAKVTGGTSTANVLSQQLVTTTSFDSHLIGLTVSAGAWVNCSNASTGKIILADGGISTSSPFHSGVAGWEWLTVTHTVDVAATSLLWQFSVASPNRVCYVSGPTVILGPVVPQYSQPSSVRYDVLTLHVHGTLTTGVTKMQVEPHRPGIVQDVQINVVTAPTGASIIVDLNTWDGAAFTSMFTARPTIAISGFRGGSQPDTTYARRCFGATFGTTVAAGGVISLDVDQVGSTVAGADLNVMIRYKTWDRPLEEFLEYNAIN